MDDLRGGWALRKLRAGASQVPADERVDQLGAPPHPADLAEVVPVGVADAHGPVGGVGVFRFADHASSVSRAYAESLPNPLPVHMHCGYSVHMHITAMARETTVTKRFRVYITRKGQFVGEGMTDGEAHWLINTHGERISGFLCNRAQVTIAANRLFGPMCSWDVMQYGHPAWEVER